jgi:hypothetical protein
MKSQQSHPACAVRALFVYFAGLAHSRLRNLRGIFFLPGVSECVSQRKKVVATCLVHCKWPSESNKMCQVKSGCWLRAPLTGMDLLPAPRQKQLFCVCMLRASEKSASLFSGGAEQTKSVFFSSLPDPSCQRAAVKLRRAKKNSIPAFRQQRARFVLNFVQPLVFSA